MLDRGGDIEHHPRVVGCFVQTDAVEFQRCGTGPTGGAGQNQKRNGAAHETVSGW